MIFHGRAAKRQPVASAQQTRGFGRFGAGVLDGLRFVEHHVIELDVLELRGVAAQRAVGGQHHIVIGEAMHIARQAGMIEHPQLRSEAGRLLLPVEHQRFGDHHQRWTGQVARRAAGFQQRQHLRGLAHAHVIGQTAAETETAQKVHPADAVPLVIA